MASACIIPPWGIRGQEAQHYRQLGWAVVPLHTPTEDAWGVRCSCKRGHKCPAIGKHPRVKWQALGPASEAQIDEWFDCWPDANIGILTGSRSGGLVPIDGDPRHGGTLAEFQEKFDDRGVRTPSLTTGGQGWHRYYQIPPGVQLRNSASKLAPGIDVRAEGGLVVTAPSMHKSGNPYRWDIGPDMPLAPLPDNILDMLTHPKFPDSGAGKAESESFSKLDRHSLDSAGRYPDSGIIAPWPLSTPEARYWLDWALSRVDYGTRNDTGLALACQLRDNGLAFDEARLIMLAYAEAIASLGNHLYLPQQALDTLQAVWGRPGRAPTVLIGIPDYHSSDYTYPTHNYPSNPDRDRLQALSKVADSTRHKRVYSGKPGHPADARLTAQHKAFEAAWEYTYPDCPLRPEDVRRWFSMVPRNRHEAESLVTFLFAVHDAPHGASIHAPRAHFLACLCQATGRKYRAKPKPRNAPQRPPEANLTV